MPPQEDPPVDRVYPDDPDLLLRDLEELPPITEPPAKQPHSSLEASHPKAPPGDKLSPPAKDEPHHSHPPDLGKGLNK